ncbi:hypothetical protein UFOVP672_27 [uncultured Caudovirales phage]|uniref:Uncharacterized protein n=1 Tax=uncultured Caudovirales phage TaxID=2100421 RepID=A0A6J5NDV2_9CAUD|nr:hypothetical protein UFOVP672_27 [uncultured Caudovirales phage]
MATLETAHYALQKASRSNSSRLSTANVASGQIEFMQIPYTLTGSEATNDVLNLCVLPAGAILIPQLSSVSNAAAGTALTLKIGNAQDDDGLLVALAVQAAGNKPCAPVSGTQPAYHAQTALTADTGFPGNTVIYATLTLVTTPTAAVVMYFNIAFKRNRG